MSTPPKSPGSLLRSLGADGSLLESRSRTAARDAEQRWPLFRTLAPAKNDATPALTTEDKLAWQAQKPQIAEIRKPAISRGAIGSKLAEGLSKLVKKSPTVHEGFTGTAAPDPVLPTASRPNRRQPLASESSAAVDDRASKPTPEQAPTLFSAPSPQRHSPAPSASRSTRTTLFNRSSSAPEPAASAPQRSAGALFGTQPSQALKQTLGADTLSTIFQRVEGNPVAAETQTPSVSTRNRRLGKR